MSRTECDVVVIGAGPGGCAASIELARAGHSVTLIDKAAFPRDKICGDGLTTSALRSLEYLGLSLGSLPTARPIHNVVVRSPRGFEATFPLPEGPGLFGVVATRLELDAALVQVARDTGVVVREQCGIAELHESPSHLTVGGSDGWSCSTQHVVAADGMWSPTRKLVGANIAGYRGDWHAFRQYVTDVSERAQRELFISFDAAILPGYFWSFPLADGRANIGFGIQRGHKHSIQEMKLLWPQLLSLPYISEFLGPNYTPAAPHRAWPIPCQVDSMTAHAAGVLFVGDAVAPCDVMTGEGIGQALETGLIAARTISEQFGNRTAAGPLYQQRVRSEFTPDHQMASLLVRALQHRKGARAALRVAATNDWTRRNFARWLFEDYPRGIALEPQLWKRGALSGPGAFHSYGGDPR